MPQAELCRAIKEWRRVSFLYRGERRSVDPYVVYEDTESVEILLDGIGPGHVTLWLTFRVADITDVRLERHFKPVVPDAGNPRYEKTLCILEMG